MELSGYGPQTAGGNEGDAVASPGLKLPDAPEREPEYGHDALVVCDNLVRIYQSENIEVQALQGLDLLVLSLIHI